MAILEPASFLGFANLQGMCAQFPEFGIISLGMMLAMMSGGIDLSLVGIANLSGVVGCVVMLRMGGSNSSVLVGILIGILCGMACGIFNGFLVGYLQIPPMLVTLGGLQVYTGLALAITKGPALIGLPERFSVVGNGTLAGLPISTIIFVLLAVMIGFLLKSTVYGQHLCYMGTNSITAKYSGINNLKVTIKTYGLSGILGGIAGIIMASHYNSAKSDYGSSYTLLSLLIVVLGGTNPDGGKGKVIGVSMAVIVLQLISSAFNIMRVNSFLKTFIWGIVLLIVVSGTEIMAKKKERN